MYAVWDISFLESRGQAICVRYGIFLVFVSHVAKQYVCTILIAYRTVSNGHWNRNCYVGLPYQRPV
jgi:hypothetical protein